MCASSWPPTHSSCILNSEDLSRKSEQSNDRLNQCSHSVLKSSIVCDKGTFNEEINDINNAELILRNYN